MLWSMDGPTLDERLPALYRQILDAASELEGCGLRAEALRARRRAALDYRTWDERSERRLRSLLVAIRHRLDGPPRGQGRGSRLRVRLGRERAGSAVQPSA
jgi:hypothetical protein